MLQLAEELLLFLRLTLRVFHLRMNAFVVGLIDRGVRIAVMLTKNPRLVVERFRELDSPASLISFRETVVNIRRRRIAFNVRLDSAAGKLAGGCVSRSYF